MAGRDRVLCISTRGNAVRYHGQRRSDERDCASRFSETAHRKGDGHCEHRCDLECKRNHWRQFGGGHHQQYRSLYCARFAAQGLQRDRQGDEYCRPHGRGDVQSNGSISDPHYHLRESKPVGTRHVFVDGQWQSIRKRSAGSLERCTNRDKLLFHFSAYRQRQCNSAWKRHCQRREPRTFGGFFSCHRQRSLERDRNRIAAFGERGRGWNSTVSSCRFRDRE